MSTPDDLVPRLQRVPLFARIDAGALAQLVAFMHVETFADGDLIFHERDPGGSMYVIEAGSVVVSKIIDWDDMNEKTLAILPTGAFFGEGGLLENEPRSAIVRARGPTTTIRLDREGFLKVLQHSPLAAVQVLFGITRIINARLRATSHELVTLFDTGKLAGAGLGLEELLERILERAVESTHSTQGWIFLINPYTEELELGAARGVAPPLGPFDRHGGLFGEVLDQGKPVLSASFSSSGTPRQGFEPEVLVACGIRHDDSPVGLLVVGEREGGARYNGSHIHLLQGIAMQVATAIENARKRAEEEAAEAHKRHYVRF